MKTKFKYAACLLFLLAALASCKKDVAEPVEESPFFVFFDQPSITIDTTPVAATTWEYGFVFNPLVDGNITKLGLKLPVTGEFSVKLWDLSGSTPVVLSDQKVTSAISHTPAFVSIPDIAVRKDAKLGITVLANSFYRIQKQNAAEFAFPMVAGNIRIVSFNEEMNNMNLAVFPQTTNTNRVAACVNVVFVAD
jgi:hypothetical protein